MNELVWSHWSQADLQGELNKIDKNLLPKLELIIPRIEGVTNDNSELYLKKNLIRILKAFATSNYFNKRDNMIKCLNRLPKDVLFNLSNYLEIESKSKKFDEFRDKIASKKWNNKDFSKKFIDFFKLPGHFLPPGEWNPPDFEDYFPPTKENPIHVENAYKPLMDFQFDIYIRCIKKISIPFTRFIVQMPTGSGKTRTAMEFTSRFINDSNENIIVIWLAHSEELCEQAFQCFKEVFIHVAKKCVRSCRCWGTHPITPSYDSSMFVVAGFQKLHSALKKNPEIFEHIKDRIGLIIVDEAHKSTAPTYKKVINSLIGNSNRIVGLSATPGRAISEETEGLSDFYFGKKIGLKVPNGKSEITILKQRKILSQINSEPLITNLTYELTKLEIKSLEKYFDFPPGFLERLAKDDIRNIEIMKRLIHECNSGHRILFFSCNIAHSKFITALLIYFGINAAHIDGNTGKTMRRTSIQGFKNGEIQVLCNYGVLSTGFDAPNTDVVFISRPTNSIVLYSQMIGRGLRGPKIGGTERCKIIDVRDNIVDFGNQENVYDYFEEYWLD